MDPAEVAISVVFCAPGVEDVCELRLPAGSTVADAVAASGIVARHPELAAWTGDVGIWGTRCAPESRLANGDRVELYRPLTIDPKEARRRRAIVRRQRNS